MRPSPAPRTEPFRSLVVSVVAPYCIYRRETKMSTIWRGIPFVCCIMGGLMRLVLHRDMLSLFRSRIPSSHTTTRECGTKFAAVETWGDIWVALVLS